MRPNPTSEQDLIPSLRQAVIQHVERTTLRQVARQIGMTPSGLSKFMAGAEPYRKIRRKLEAWFTQTAAQADVGIGVHEPDAAAAAIRVLSTYFSPEDRGAFVDEILARLDPVLPSDGAWRAELARYGDYMRVGQNSATIGQD
jgi:hypothetical protein